MFTNGFTNADEFYVNNPIEALEQTNSERGPGYGRALYWAVAEKNREYQEKVKEDFEKLVKAFTDGGEVEAFVTDRSVHIDVKLEFIDELAEELKAAEPLVKVIKGMMEEERYDWWEEALTAYKQYVIVGNKQQEVNVITSSEALMPEIEAKARGCVTPGYEPIITYTVDPELGGGYRIIVDNAYMYDFSGRTAQNELQNRINEALPLIQKTMAKIKLEESGWLQQDLAAVGL